MKLNQTPKGQVPSTFSPFVTVHTLCVSRDGTRNSPTGFLRTVPLQSKVFFAVYIYAGKAVLSQQWRKLGKTTHFLEITFGVEKMPSFVNFVLLDYIIVLLKMPLLYFIILQSFVFRNKYCIIISKNGRVIPNFFLGFNSPCLDLLCPHSHIVISAAAHYNSTSVL